MFLQKYKKSIIKNESEFTFVNLADFVF